MMPLLKTHPLLNIFRGALVDLPSPSSLSSWWNFGSLLGLCLMMQLATGILLSMHYVGDISMAFESVSHMGRDVNLGWMLRMMHANGASLFFTFLYLHAGRGMYYGSYSLHMTWSVGVLLFLAVMAAAFMGYVLPWGQMSFWGATVITSLFSAIPMLGPDIVSWIWGGFAVDAATLTRFFAFHFVIPFIVLAMVLIHLLFLHQSGSNNPLGMMMNSDKVPFHPYFTSKDMAGFSSALFVLGFMVLLFPWSLGDPENFIPANPLVTPVHIQPEWYFLFAYAILRSIPNKLGGVVALALAVLILLVLPLESNQKFQSKSMYPVSKAYFWALVGVVLLLTWIGARPVEEPYVMTGQLLTLFYFSYFFLGSLVSSLWDASTD